VGEVDEVMSRIDLRPQTGRYEAGAVVDTVVAAHDPGYELTTLSFAGGELVVPSVQGLVGERVRVRIRARDVSLALARPEQLSIVNILEASIVAFSAEEGPIVDVQLRVGDAALSARITRRSRDQMRLRVGQRVYAMVKAVSFDRRSVGYA
jgi:molybdate transport system ATP-binding protein